MPTKIYLRGHDENGASIEETIMLDYEIFVNLWRNGTNVFMTDTEDGYKMAFHARDVIVAYNA